MIASLPMYDMPHARGALDRLWQGIRTALPRAPERLSRPADLWSLWQSPGLFLAQTCGLPFRARLAPHVTLIGSPVHDLPDTPAGHYHSVILTRPDHPARTPTQLSGARFAYNEAMSQSGWAAPMAHFAPLNLGLGPLIETGAHAASVLAVAEGRADACAIDAVTWAMLCDCGGDRGLRPIGRTAPTPALPYITARGNDPEPLFDALGYAIAGLSQTDRATLHLNGITRISAQDYLALPLPPPQDIAPC